MKCRADHARTRMEETEAEAEAEAEESEQGSVRTTEPVWLSPAGLKRSRDLTVTQKEQKSKSRGQKTPCPPAGGQMSLLVP